MDFSNEIVKFMSDEVGGIVIIADNSLEIVYADAGAKRVYGDDIVGMDAENVFRWIDECPTLTLGAAQVEWEEIDSDSKKYYKFNSALFEKDGKNYQIHLQTDITEYMGLNRDITKYMSFFKKLSAFQTAVLERLSNTYYELMPMLSEYFKTSKAFFMIQRGDKLDVIAYTRMGNMFSNDRIDFTEEVAHAFEMNVGDDILFESFAPSLQRVFDLNGSKEGSTFRLLCTGEALEQKYAIFFPIWPNMDIQSMGEKTLINVIKLFVENSMLREKLLYDSEHDQLTGLFNKGKYLKMVEKEFVDADSIAIFNFDVNDLKVMNDTMGHEAGDKLLIKAADSIRRVLNSKTYGYRMGGDEFLMIAQDATKEEVDNIRARWEDELARLNTEDDGIKCVMAIGVAYGEKGYDFAALAKQADELMYEDKKKKKGPGATIR